MSAVFRLAPCLSLLFLACAAPDNAPSPVNSGTVRQAAVANGAFDANWQQNWNVVTAINNNGNQGLLLVPPARLDDMALEDPNSDFSASTRVLVGAAASLQPSELASSNALRLPFRNASCVALNQNGDAGHASSLEQSFALSLDDLDAVDHRPRIRAIVAPVMSNAANHTPSQTSYVTMRLDRGAANGNNLDAAFINADAPGVPWQADGNSRFYGWQILELTPSLLDVAVGAPLRLQLWAAGCSRQKHFSSLYVDSVGAAANNGTSAIAYGPGQVRAGGTVTYELRVRQEGRAGEANAVVSAYLPASLHFVSLSTPAGWQCQSPNVGDSGYVACRLPALPAGQAASVWLTATVAANAGDVLSLATYGVAAAGLQTLLGPTVSSRVLDGSATLSSLRVTAQRDESDDRPDGMTMQVVLANDGEAAAQGARLTDAAGAGLAPAQWSCRAGAGASCGGGAQASGQGALALSGNIAAGANITCTVTLRKSSGVGTTTYAARTTPADPTSDALSPAREAVALVGLHAFAPTAGPTQAGAAPLGTPCTSDDHCQSGLCADGVCCDGACGGACQACDVTGHAGTCTPLDGAAPRPGHPGCGPYTCHAGACGSACEHDADCIAGTTCAGGVCRPSRNVCQANEDCPAGRFCTPAHTCESAATQDPNHPNWSLLGSGCRHGDAGAAGGAWALAVGGALVLGWRRRRGRAAAVSALLSMVAVTARGADSTNVPTNRFLPKGGAYDAFGTSSPTVAEPFHFSLKVWANYAQSPLRLVTNTRPKVQQDIVHNQATLDLTGSIALPWRLELGAALPVVLQRSAAAPFVSEQIDRHNLQAALGDLRLSPKWGLLESDALRVGLGVFITAPTGRKNRFISLGDASYTPSAMLEVGARAGMRLLVNAGAVLRPARNLADVRLRHALSWSAAAVLPRALSAGSEARLSVGAFGESNLRRRQPYAQPAEAVATLGWATGGFSVEAGGGAGLNNGLGAPRWRVLAAVAYAPRPKGAEPAPAAPAPAPAPKAAAPVASAVPTAVADRDHDGVPDAADACPDVAGPAGGERPGCPPVAAAAAKVETLRLVTFASNDAHIGKESAALLEQVRQMLVAHAEMRLAIEGHTDDVGVPSENLALSRRRARATAAWLVAQGIDRGRLEARGYGSQRPQVRGTTPAARARNRRVAFRLLEARPAPQPRPQAAPGNATQR